MADTARRKATARARRTWTTTVATRAYGLVFLLVLSLLVGLSVAAYNNAFTRVVDVTLEANRIGNQLQKQSDVKIRGLLVGEVRDITSDGEKASVRLALDPAHVELVPANVEARLLPKTLFGEKYVSLVEPATPAARHIREGDVITQDRSKAATELETVFEGLLPLLQAVEPQDLAITLNAMATALEGRGERLGENLTLVHDYFRQLNPHMPALQADISGLADVASLYADTAPDLLRMLRNFTTTGATIVDKQDTLIAFLEGTTGFADTTREVLSENEQRIIQLGRVSRPTLEVLAKHSHTYPCTLQGMAGWLPRIQDAWAGGALHITLEVVPQREPYKPGDEPRWGETKKASCYDLPNPPGSQKNPGQGVHFDDGAATSNSRVPAALVARPAPVATPLVDPSSGLAGTASERHVVGALLAPQLGTPPDEVPDIATLLFGPMARGTVVVQR
jgi:virulence factor Mce-like protein